MHARTRGALRAVAFVLAAAYFTVPASAQFETGDVIVSVSRPSGIPPETESWIKIYAAAGAFKSQIPLPSRVAMRDLNFHDGTLFGSLLGGDVYRIDAGGELTWSGFRGSFVFDAFGNVYTTIDQTIRKFDPAGNLVSTWPLPNYLAHQIDLAADQCTMYYTSTLAPGPGSTQEISRFNVCTSEVLSPLITGLEPTGGTFRVLPAGDVLLGRSNGVLRITANGQIVRTYPGYFQIALDPDGRSFWAVNGLDSLWKVDLETGGILATTAQFGGFGVDSLTVVGEPRAALLAEAAIPSLSQWLLIALAITVAGIGLWRLHS